MSYRIDRRQFITQGAALAVSATALPSVAVANFDSDLNLVARRAAQLGRRTNATLRLLHPVGCEDNLAPVVSEFKARTGLDVELIKGSLDDIGSEVRFNETVEGSGKAFDLAIPATFSLPGLVNDGLLTDLSGFAAEHEPPALKKEMLYTLGDSFDGRFYGYQTDGDVYLMFYNHGLPGFSDLAAAYSDRHGVGFETPVTWDEFDRQIATFHHPANGVFGGSLYRTKRYVAWEFWSRLHGNGVMPVDEAFEPQLEQPGSVAALEALIAATRNLDPQVREHGLFDNFKSFADGQKYANIGWGGTQKYLMRPDSNVRSHLRHGLLPGGVDKSSGQAFSAPIFNWGWNYVVPKSSKNPELAYLYSLFSTLPAMSALAVQQPGGYFDPHQRSHYEHREIATIYGTSFMQAHKQSMIEAIPDFHVHSQERYMRLLGEAVFATASGRISPELALRSASSQWRKLTDEVERGKQVERWSQLASIYPSQIRSATQ